MLHAAPTSETKTETAQSKTQVVPQPKREQHPRLLSAAGLHSSGEMSSVRSSASPQIQRRQTLTRMQGTYGNQAILRMMRSPQQVARMTALLPSQGMMLQRKCACGSSSETEGECAECKAKREATLQRRATNSNVSPPVGKGVPSVVHDVLSSPGQPLDAGTRAFMEPRFGHDFGRVRVHTDAKAAESAQAVNALAYTVGQNLVFGVGQYAPGTSEGKRLLAHELTHVVQQSMSPTSTQAGLMIDPSPEQEAEAHHIANSPQVVSVGTRRTALQRTPAGPPLISLPVVDPKAISASWKETPVPLSGGRDVYVYRGIDKNAANRLGNVVPEGEIGGVLSRRMDVAQDAIFNLVGRDPVLSGSQAGGVIRVRVPAELWDELVRTNSISERGNYPGFLQRLNSTEIRINSAEAARVINSLPQDIIPPDPYYDFRPGAVRPSKPQSVASPQEQPPTTTPTRARQTPPPEGRPETPRSTIEAPGSSVQAPGGTPVELPVRVHFNVLSSTQQEGGLVSEVEVLLTEGLEELNRAVAARGAQRLPARLVIRIRHTPNGILTAAEAVTRESSALAETLARQALATIPRIASSEAAGAGIAGAARVVSPWVKGIGWAGTIVFIAITVHQLATATPEQRPRVATTVAGGLVSGAVSGYVVCNLLLGIETVGWSLLICGTIVGGAGGYVGSETAGQLYDIPGQLTRATISTLRNTIDILNAARQIGRGVVSQTFVRPLLVARATVDPTNWDLSPLPSSARADIGLLGAYLWARLEANNADHFLTNITRPLSTYPIPVDLMRNIANAMGSAVNARTGFNVTFTAELLLQMTPLTFVQFLKDWRLLLFRQDPEQIAGAALANPVAPNP